MKLASSPLLAGTLRLVSTPPSSDKLASVRRRTPAPFALPELEQSGIGVCAVLSPAVKQARFVSGSGAGGVTHELGAATFEFWNVSEMTGVPAAPAGVPEGSAATAVAASGAAATATTIATQRPLLLATPPVE